jgi:hypothetical protein
LCSAIEVIFCCNSSAASLAKGRMVSKEDTNLVGTEKSATDDLNDINKLLSKLK